MNLTDLFSLPEPGDQDFANGPLQLQMLANAADAQIWALQQAFTGNLRTAAGIYRSTSDFTTSANQTLAPFNANGNVLSFGAFTPVYQNLFTDRRIIPEPGSYMFGCYANVLATGTVNANTLRQFEIGASVPSGPQFTTQKQYLYQETALEANNGLGMFLCATGAFDYVAVPNASPQQLWWGFFHNNTGSTVSVKAGALWWCIKISDIAS